MSAVIYPTSTGRKWVSVVKLWRGRIRIAEGGVSRLRRRTYVALACLTTGMVALAGCSSSGPAKQAPPSNTDVTSTSASSSTAPSTPSTPASTSSSAPLSKFESDPAIRAFRAWAAQAARTVNTGHYTSAALQQLMTPAFAKTMKNILGDEVGRYYPGPVPFTPINLSAPTANTRDSSGCLESDGFAQNPKTHKPAAAKTVDPVTIHLVEQNGHWLMNNLTGPAKVSCAGVTIGTPRW